MTGIIDKLIVSNDTVRTFDFKSNAVVPASADEVPEGLLRQMGAYLAMLETVYPDRRIEVSLVWTKTAEIMFLPREIVRAALSRYATS
jgi:ATP-dependent helicase/nuclease subunit A